MQTGRPEKIIPKDVTINPFYEQADFVKDSIKSVTDSLLIGLALAIIVAIIFLRSFQSQRGYPGNHPGYPMPGDDLSVCHW
jgi:hypothetical protein